MDKPKFIRKRYDPEDGRVRCWACKDYVGCGDHFVGIVAARATKKLPVIALCTACAREVGRCAISAEERREQDAMRRGFNWASEHGWEDVLDVQESSPTTRTRLRRGEAH